MRTHRAIVGAALVFLVGASAWAAGSTASKLKGQILISDQPVPTLDDEDKIADVLKKWQKATIEKPKESDTWSFHMVSFPDKKPGVTSLSLLIFDVSEGKPKYLTSRDISCDAAAEILASDVDLNGEDGVKAGMKVDLTLAKIVAGRQTDLAKAKLTLK